MKEETYTPSEKIFIAHQIKPISIEDVNHQMEQLIQLRDFSTISPRSRLGNDIVDYFTFVARLETRGKYNVSYFEFLKNLPIFRKKKFIQTMEAYYNTKKRMNKYKKWKEIYNICISAINIMKPINCMELFMLVNARRVLNYCCGWGGSMVAAAALNLDNYYGIDSNRDLVQPYRKMIQYLSTKSQTKCTFQCANANEIDYSTIQYDTIFVSPPYYFIEMYPHAPVFQTKDDMDEYFYRPIFLSTYKYLIPGGAMIINVNQDIFDRVLYPLFGRPSVVRPLKKSSRQNKYQEWVYIWIKPVARRRSGPISVTARDKKKISSRTRRK